MLLFGLAGSFLWPITHDCGLCVLERGNWLEILDMLIKKRMFLLLSPCHPEAQTRGFFGFSVWYRPRISDDLLPGFRTVITLMPGVPSGHPRTFSLLHLGPKCSCVAPGETLSNFARTSQTPVSCTAPSLLQYMALSVLCPALYSLDRKRSAWF